MKTLDRYVIREILPPFFLALGVFTFALAIQPMLLYAQNLLAKNVPLHTVGFLLLTLLPQSLGVTIPMALLAGLLMALGRLSGDREAVALLACGVNPLRLLRPILSSRSSSPWPTCTDGRRGPERQPAFPSHVPSPLAPAAHPRLHGRRGPGGLCTSWSKRSRTATSGSVRSRSTCSRSRPTRTSRPDCSTKGSRARSCTSAATARAAAGRASSWPTRRSRAGPRHARRVGPAQPRPRQARSRHVALPGAGATCPAPTRRSTTSRRPPSRCASRFRPTRSSAPAISTGASRRCTSRTSRR